MNIRTRSGTDIWNNVEASQWSYSAAVNTYTNVEVGSWDGSTYSRIGRSYDFDSSEDSDATSFQFEEDGTLVFQFRFGGLGYSSNPTPTDRDRPSTDISVNVDLTGNPRLKFVDGDGSLLTGRSLELDFDRPGSGFTNAQMSANITLTMDTGTEEESGMLTYTVDAIDGAYELVHDTVEEPVLTFTPFGVTPSGPQVPVAFDWTCPLAPGAFSRHTLRLTESPTSRVDWTTSSSHPDYENDLYFDTVPEEGAGLQGHFSSGQTDSTIEVELLTGGSTVMPLTISFTSTDTRYNNIELPVTLVWANNDDDCPEEDTTSTPDPVAASFTTPTATPVAGRWLAVPVAIDNNPADDETVVVRLTKADAAADLVFNPANGEVELDADTKTGMVSVRFDGGLQAVNTAYGINIVSESDASNHTAPLDSSFNVSFTSNQNARFILTHDGVSYFPTSANDRPTVTLNMLRGDKEEIPYLGLNGVAPDSDLTIHVAGRSNTGVTIHQQDCCFFRQISFSYAAGSTTETTETGGRSVLTLTVQNNLPGADGDVREAILSVSIRVSNDLAYQERADSEGGTLDIKVNILPTPLVRIEFDSGDMLRNDGTAATVSLTMSALPEGQDVTVSLGSNPAGALTFNKQTVVFTSVNHDQWEEVEVMYSGALTEVSVLVTTGSQISFLHGVEAELEVAVTDPPPATPGPVVGFNFDAAVNVADRVHAGRWTELTVSIDIDPQAGHPVTVSMFSGDTSLMRFNPPHPSNEEAGRVVIDGGPTDADKRAVMSVRIDGYLPGDGAYQIRSGAESDTTPAISGGSQMFDGVTFLGISQAYFSIEHGGNWHHPTSGVGGNAPIITVNLLRNTEASFDTRLFDGNSGLLPIADVSVYLSWDDDGDDRVSVRFGDSTAARTDAWVTYQSSLNPSGGTDNVVVTVNNTPQNTVGQATLSAYIESDDGAYDAYKRHQGEMVSVVVNVVPDPAVGMSHTGEINPNGATAQEVMVTFSPLPEGANVNVAISAVPSAGVDFLSDTVLNFDSDNYNTPQLVEFTYDGTGGASQIQVRGISQGGSESFLNGIVGTRDINVQTATTPDPMPPPVGTGAPGVVMEAPVPAMLPAGRWREVTVTVSGARSTPVTLFFLSRAGSNSFIDVGEGRVSLRSTFVRDDPNCDDDSTNDRLLDPLDPGSGPAPCDPRGEPGRVQHPVVTLAPGQQEAVVSVARIFHRPVLTGTSDMYDITVSLSSSETAFNEPFDSFTFTYSPNANSRVSVSTDSGTDIIVCYDTRDPCSTPRLFNRGGETREIEFRLGEAEGLVEDVTVSLSLPGNPRISVRDDVDRFVFSPPYSDVASMTRTLTVDYSGTSGSQNIGGLNFNFYSDDGAYGSNNAIGHPAAPISLRVDLFIKDNPIRIEVPGGPQELDTDVDVRVRLEGLDPAGDVNVVVDLSPDDMDLTLPSQVVLTSPDYDETVQAQYPASSHTTGTIERVVITGATGASASTDDTFNNWSTTAELLFTDAPIAIAHPSAAVYPGRWAAIPVNIFDDPTAAVNAQLNASASDLGLLSFDPSSRMVVLDADNHARDIRVRYTGGYLGTDATIQLTLAATSSDSGYDGESATLTLTVSEISDAYLNLGHDGRVAYPTSDNANATVTLKMTGNGLAGLTVSLPGEIYPVANYLQYEIAVSGDSRVNVRDTNAINQRSLAFQRFNEGDPAIALPYTVVVDGNAGNAVAEAEILFTYDMSRDEPFSLYAGANGNTARAKVFVVPTPVVSIEIDNDDGAISNDGMDLVTVTLSMGVMPADTTVTVSFGAPGVDFVGANNTVVFDESNFGAQQELSFTYRGTADEIDLVARTSSRDDVYDGLEFTQVVMANTSGAPPPPPTPPSPEVRFTMPGNVMAGRWTEVVVTISSDPAAGEEVEVRLDATGIDPEDYMPASGRVTLMPGTDESRSATISVRRDGYLTGDQTDTFEISSSGGGATIMHLDGELFDLTFYDNQLMEWYLNYQAGPVVSEIAEPDEAAGTQAPTITMTVVKGGEAEIDVVMVDEEFNFPLENGVGITVEYELVTGGDDRVGIKDVATDSGELAFLDTTTTNSPATQDVTVEIEDRGSGSGSARVRFTASSDDGGFTAYGNENGFVIEALVSIIDQPELLISDPALRLDGTREVRVSMNVAPPRDMTVTLSTTSTGASVNPATQVITPDNYEDGVAFDVSCDATCVEGVDSVALTADSNSNHDLFNRLMATRNLDVVDAVLDVGDPGTVVAGRWTTFEVRALVDLGSAPDQNVTVRLTKTNSDIKFRHPTTGLVDDEMLVTLSSADPQVPVDVRYAVHTPDAVTDVISAVADSDGNTLYDGETAMTNVEFTSNAQAYARVFDFVNTNEEVGTDPARYAFTEGETTSIPVNLGGLVPEENVTVTFVAQSGSDSGIRFVGGDSLEFDSSNHGDQQMLMVTIDYTSGDTARSATFEIQVTSDDGAYAVHQNAVVPIRRLVVRVNHVTLHMSAPDPVTAGPDADNPGPWTTAELWITPSDASATVQLSSTNNNVEFNPPAGENIIIEPNVPKEISIRYGRDVAADTTAMVFANGIGGHVGLSASREVSFVTSQLAMAEIDDAVAGHWTEFVVSLPGSSGPSSDVNVQLTAVPNANVEFMPTSGMVVLNATNMSRTMSVRYNAYTASDVEDVAIEALSTATDPGADAIFHQQPASRMVTFESNAGARWSVSDGTAAGTRYPDSTTNIITVVAFQGNDAQVEISLDSVSPVANVTITPSEAADPDNLVTAPSVIEFTPGGVRSFNVDIVVAATGTGKATLDFDMTTDDRAYQLYAAETGHGSKLQVEIEVVDQPLAMGAPNPDPVVAGRWTETSLRLSSTMGLGSHSVTVVLSSADNVEFMPSTNIVLRNTTPTVVSIRHTLNVDSTGFNIEVTATSDSGNDDYDNTVELTIGVSPNSAMLVDATEPSDVEVDDTNVEVSIPVNLGAAVEGIVDVQVEVMTEPPAFSNRVSRPSGNLRFENTQTGELLLTVSATPNSREEPFDVNVNFEILDTSTDGAYAIRQGTDMVSFEVSDTTQGMVRYTPTGPINIDEGSSTALTVSLSVQPLEDVVVNLTPSDSVSLQVVSQTGAPVSQLTFTQMDWNDGNRAQVVILTTRADFLAEGDKPVMLDLAVSSSDSNFDMALDDPSIDVVILENDTASISITPTDGARVEAGEELEYAVVLTSEPTGNVMIAIDLDIDRDDPMTFPDGLTVTPEMQENMVFTPGNWDMPQTLTMTVTTRDDEVEIQEDIPFELSFDPSSSDSDYDLAAIIRTGDVRRSNVGASEHVGKSVAAVDLGAAQFALDVVGGQIGGSIGGGGVGTPQTGNLNLSRPGSTDEDDGWGSLETGWRSDFGSLVRNGAGFSMPFGEDADVVMWGQVGFYDFEGNSEFEMDVAEYDGEAFGVVYGLGWRRASGTAFGLALSHTSSNTDLTNAGDLVEVENKVLSLHPYYGFQIGDRTRAWVVGSIGRGDIDITLDDGDVVGTGTRSHAFGAGLEHTWNAMGLDIAARFEGIAGRSKLDESEELSDEGIVNEDDTPIASKMQRARIELELGRTIALESGGTARPYLSAGGRYDGGDLDGVSAFELGGGVRSSFAGAYSIDLKLRAQVNDADHKEHSASGKIGYDAAGDRRGLVASFEQGIDNGESSSKASVGYGWGSRLFGQNGIAGPRLSYDNDDGMATSVGFESTRLRLRVERDEDESGVWVDFIAR